MCSCRWKGHHIQVHKEQAWKWNQLFQRLHVNLYKLVALEGFALQVTTSSWGCSGMTGSFYNGWWKWLLAICFHLWSRGSFIVQSGQEKFFHESQDQQRPLAMDLLTTAFSLFLICPFTCHQGWWKVFDSASFAVLPLGAAQPLNVVASFQRTSGNFFTALTHLGLRKEGGLAQQLHLLLP